MKYHVISEYVERATGKRRKPGEVIEADHEKAEALARIGVLGEPIKEPKKERAERATVKPPEDATKE
jgi:hypothetical protein